MAVSAVGEQMRDSFIGMLVCEREEEKTREARERQDGLKGEGTERQRGPCHETGVVVWGHGIGIRLVWAWVVVGAPTAQSFASKMQ